MPDDHLRTGHLRSKIDNENNYNTIFVQSQNIDKNNYKSSALIKLGPH